MCQHCDDYCVIPVYGFCDNFLVKIKIFLIGWIEGYGLPGFLLIPAIILEIIAPILIIIGYQIKI